MPSKLRSKLRSSIFGHMTDESAKVSRNNLKDLAAYLGIPAGPWAEEDAIALMMEMSEKVLNVTAKAWKEDVQRRMKPTSAKRRTAALKSAWTRISDDDLTRHRLKLSNPHVEATRKEFPPEDVRRFLDQVETEAKEGMENGVRNHPIILLLYERLLARFEVTALCWPDDVDLRKPAVRVGGEWLTVNRPCRAAIDRHSKTLAKDWCGPLFTPRASNERMFDATLNHTIKAIGERAGLKYRVSPQLLWQAAIDRVIELGLDLRTAAEFCRVSVMTIQRHIAKMPKRNKPVGRKVLGTPKTEPGDKGLWILYGSAEIPALVRGAEVKFDPTEYRTLEYLINNKDKDIDVGAIKKAGVKRPGVTIARIRKRAGDAAGDLKGPGQGKPGFYSLPMGIIRRNPSP